MENKFPQNLTHLLNQKIVTVDEILKITGYTSPGTVSMWKNGERKISTDDIIKIANHLGYTIDELTNKDIVLDAPLSQNQIDKIYSDLREAIDIELKKQDDNGSEIMINEKDSLSASDFKKILELAELEPDKLKKALEVIDLITK